MSMPLRVRLHILFTHTYIHMHFWAALYLTHSKKKKVRKPSREDAFRLSASLTESLLSVCLSQRRTLPLSCFLRTCWSGLPPAVVRSTVCDRSPHRSDRHPREDVCLTPFGCSRDAALVVSSTRVHPSEGGLETECQVPELLSSSSVVWYFSNYILLF